MRRIAGLGNAGFTLAEVLVGISLFSVASLSIVALFTSVTRVSTVNDRSVTAVQLAEDELEELRSLPYALVDERSASFSVDGVEYLMSTSVTADTPVRNVKYITVTLSWPDQDGGSRTLAIDTIYAQTDS